MRTSTLIGQATAIISSILSLQAAAVAAAGAAAAASAVASPGAAQNFPALLDATLDDLRRGLDSGSFTSVDLVNAYIARIGEVQAQLHAVTELNPDARSIAAQADAERAHGADAGLPLHGIPVLIKNNIATDDLMNNTAGSYALLGAKVPYDSTVAAKLRKAGAIILGKSNLSQWANYRSANGSNGWSAHGGQTVGAYFPNQDPSGSSSGSGVSSSIGLTWASLGTETAGSILSPAAINNLVGIKPTVGLTSRHLVIPISEHQDTVGPMARTVKDAAHLLAAIAGPDPKDNYTSAFPYKDVPDYVAACKSGALKGKRIGVPRNLISGHSRSDPVFAAFEVALQILANAGAVIVENTNFPGVETIYSQLPDGEGVVLDSDFIVNLHDYFKLLKSNPNNISTLKDLLKFTDADPREDFPERDTDLWQTALARGFNNTSPQFWGNYTTLLRLAGPEGLTGALKNYTLDAVVLPTDYIIEVAALLGTPVVTVPLGKYPAKTRVRKNGFGNLNAIAPNLPFGIGFAGAKWSEETLVGIAYAFEEKTRVRDAVKPHIVPKTELKDVVKSRS